MVGLLPKYNSHNFSSATSHIFQMIFSGLLDMEQHLRHLIKSDHVSYFSLMGSRKQGQDSKLS